MTITIELNDLANLQNETTAITQINQNSETIEVAFVSALNTSGDKMLGNLDMNGNQILNLGSTTGYTVTSLPAGVLGLRVVVTDATLTTFISVVTGGGSNIVPAFYTGAAWHIG